MWTSSSQFRVRRCRCSSLGHTDPGHTDPGQLRRTSRARGTGAVQGGLQRQWNGDTDAGRREPLPRWLSLGCCSSVPVRKDKRDRQGLPLRALSRQNGTRPSSAGSSPWCCQVRSTWDHLSSLTTSWHRRRRENAACQPQRVVGAQVWRCLQDSRGRREHVPRQETDRDGRHH